MSLFKTAYVLEKPEYIGVIRNALKAQLIRLNNDKQTDEFKRAPLYIVLRINEEIGYLEELLKD